MHQPERPHPLLLRVHARPVYQQQQPDPGHKLLPGAPHPLLAVPQHGSAVLLQLQQQPAPQAVWQPIP